MKLGGDFLTKRLKKTKNSGFASDWMCGGLTRAERFMKRAENVIFQVQL